MYVYDLSPLTRRANEERRITVATFDLPRRGVMAALAAAPFILCVPVLLTQMLFGNPVTTIVVFFVLELFAAWFFSTRSSRGLHVMRHEAMRDRVKASREASTLQVCWRAVDPNGDGPVMVVRNTVELDEDTDWGRAVRNEPSPSRRTRGRR